jgi:hypothetical protein
MWNLNLFVVQLPVLNHSARDSRLLGLSSLDFSCRGQISQSIPE